MIQYWPAGFIYLTTAKAKLLPTTTTTQRSGHPGSMEPLAQVKSQFFNARRRHLPPIEQQNTIPSRCLRSLGLTSNNNTATAVKELDPLFGGGGGGRAGQLQSEQQPPRISERHEGQLCFVAPLTSGVPFRTNPRRPFSLSLSLPDSCPPLSGGAGSGC